MVPNEKHTQGEPIKRPEQLSNRNISVTRTLSVIQVVADAMCMYNHMIYVVLRNILIVVREIGENAVAFVLFTDVSFIFMPRVGNCSRLLLLFHDLLFS